VSESAGYGVVADACARISDETADIAS